MLYICNFFNYTQGMNITLACVIQVRCTLFSFYKFTKVRLAQVLKQLKAQNIFFLIETKLSKHVS